MAHTGVSLLDHTIQIENHTSNVHDLRLLWACGAHKNCNHYVRNFAPLDRLSIFIRATFYPCGRLDVCQNREVSHFSGGRRMCAKNHLDINARRNTRSKVV